MDYAAFTNRWALRFRSRNTFVTNYTHARERSVLDGRVVMSDSMAYPFKEGTLQYTVDPQDKNFIIARNLDRTQGTNFLSKFDYGGIFRSHSYSLIPPVPNVGFRNETRYDSTSYATSELHGTRFPCHESYLRFNKKIDDRLLLDGPSMFSLFGLGAECIAATLPTVPELNLSVSLAELFREGLPKIPKFRKDFREGAGELLNYQFGILPLVSDIQALSTTVNNWENLVKQLWRDNGRLVRRRIEPAEVITEEVYTHKTPAYPFVTLYRDPLRNAATECTHRTTTSTRTWFSAGYRYNLPELDGFMKTIYEFKRILGLNLNPEVLWNLVPWSWLVDWFVSTDSFMKNISYLGLEGVSIHHAYLMQTITKKTVFTNRAITCSEEQVVKTRTAASPFGFGFEFGSLSKQQLAILSALGISRMR